MVLGILAALLVATGAYALVSSQLIAQLASGESEGVESVLVPAESGKSLLYACARSDSREGSGTSGRADESGDNQRSDVMILLRS